MKKNQSETVTRQRRDSVTVSDAIASKTNNLLALLIHQDRCRAVTASDVVSDPLDASAILCRRHRCCCCSLLAHLSLPSHLTSS